MRLPRTTREIFLLITAVALFLGLVINFPWILPCVLLLALAMAPQTLVVALCAFLATRDKSNRDGITWLTDVRHRHVPRSPDARTGPTRHP
jgi:hypothetical protein